MACLRQLTLEALTLHCSESGEQPTPSAAPASDRAALHATLGPSTQPPQPRAKARRPAQTQRDQEASCQTTVNESAGWLPHWSSIREPTRPLLGAARPTASSEEPASAAPPKPAESQSPLVVAPPDTRALQTNPQQRAAEIQRQRPSGAWSQNLHPECSCQGSGHRENLTDGKVRVHIGNDLLDGQCKAQRIGSRDNSEGSTVFLSPKQRQVECGLSVRGEGSAHVRDHANDFEVVRRSEIVIINVFPNRINVGEEFTNERLTHYGKLAVPQPLIRLKESALHQRNLHGPEEARIDVQNICVERLTLRKRWIFRDEECVVRGVPVSRQVIR